VGNAWSIVWLLFITIYLINILVLVVSTGIDRYKHPSSSRSRSRRR